MLIAHPKQLYTSLPTAPTYEAPRVFFPLKLPLLPPRTPAFLLLTWAHVATGILVPDWRLAESRGAHLGVAQDASLPAGAARALVQVPRLALHVKFPAGRSAHHHVHPLWLTAA